MAEIEWGREASTRILHHISEVPSGLACACVCDECGGVLVAKKGDEVAHHFAHKADEFERSCTASRESNTHFAAKECLRHQIKRIALPGGRHMRVGHVETEKKIPGTQKIADALVWSTPDQRGTLLVIEFLFTHEKDDAWRATVDEAGLASIEITLNESNPSPEQLKEAIRETAPRVYLTPVRRCVDCDEMLPKRWDGWKKRCRACWHAQQRAAEKAEEQRQRERELSRIVECARCQASGAVHSMEENPAYDPIKLFNDVGEWLCSACYEDYEYWGFGQPTPDEEAEKQQQEHELDSIHEAEQATEQKGRECLVCRDGTPAHRMLYCETHWQEKFSVLSP